MPVCRLAFPALAPALALSLLPMDAHNRRPSTPLLPSPSDCQLHEKPGRGQGRRRHHLHAHDPRAASCHGAVDGQRHAALQHALLQHLRALCWRCMRARPSAAALRTCPPPCLPAARLRTCRPRGVLTPSLPLLPSQLACARLGAVFSVVFAGFSAESLAGRISDSNPKMVVTCSGECEGAHCAPTLYSVILSRPLPACISACITAPGVPPVPKLTAPCSWRPSAVQPSSVAPSTSS